MRDPREAEDPAADVGRAHLRRDAAGREGRADRRPVREAALGADRARRRRRDPVASAATWSTTTRRPPRRACPTRSGWSQGYHQSAATLNLLRAFTKGGFADLTQVHAWNQEFVATSPRGPALRARSRPRSSARSRSWPRAASTSRASAQLHEVDVCTSHEGLLLDYEEGLTRRDSLTGDWYDCSAHLLWIGERTRAARRRARRVLLGRAQPARRASSGRRRPPRRSSSSASG